MRSESKMILRIVLKIEGEGTDKDGLEANLASLLSMSIIVTSCYIACTSLVYLDLHHNHSLEHINKRLYHAFGFVSSYKPLEPSQYFPCSFSTAELLANFSIIIPARFFTKSCYFSKFPQRHPSRPLTQARAPQLSNRKLGPRGM